MISVKNLDKYFNHKKENEIHVLNNISIDFDNHGLVVLHGPSGSGKTTLLNVIGGLDKVSSGEFIIDNEHINGYPSGKWDLIRNEQIGYVFQNYYLLPTLSVFDNVSYVLKMMGIKDQDFIKQRVDYVLTALGLYPFRKKNAFQLSGGQQQRVGIARALVKDPKIIIADEPTGNLDSKNTTEIMNIIKAISKHKPVILVTHEKDLASIYADRIIELKDGQIVNDYINDTNYKHQDFEKSKIYLKDLKTLSNYNDSNVNLKYYTNDDKKNQFVDVNFVLKEETLFINVNTTIKKVHLIQNDDYVQMLDEHHREKTKDEQLHTDYDLTYFSHENVKKESKLLVSFKALFLNALKYLLNLGKKGKLAIIGFVLAGAMLGIAASLYTGVSYVDVDDSLLHTKDYVLVDTLDSNLQDVNSFLDQTQDYVVNIMNVQQSVQINLKDLPLSATSVVEYWDSANLSLVFGNSPTKPNEMIISKKTADKMISSSTFNTYGLWTYEDLLIEDYQIDGVDFKISGVSADLVDVVFLNHDYSLQLAFVHLGNGVGETAYHIDSFKGTLINGVNPNDTREIMISERFYNIKFASKSIPFQIASEDFNYTVTGVFQGSDSTKSIYTNTLTFIDYYLNNSHHLYLQTPDASKAIAKLESSSVNATYHNLYKETYDQIAKERQQLVGGITGFVLVIVIFSFLGFYFIMRSQMVSRIYQISVQRALGVSKWNIIASFLVEILVITTVSSLIGLSLISYLVYLLQNDISLFLPLLRVTPLSFGLSFLLMYGLNIVSGLSPIIMFLRKTPAAIFAKYDI